MNSRERLLKTINGGIPDRVPVTLFIQDHGHFIHQMHPDIDPLDYEQLTFKVIDYQKSLGCDVFVRMIFDLYHPLGICLGGVDDGHETETWKISAEITEDGNNLIRKSEITTPDGILTPTEPSDILSNVRPALCVIQLVPSVVTCNDKAPV